MTRSLRYATLALLIVACHDATPAVVPPPPPPPAGMPLLERRPLAIADSDLPEGQFWPFGVRTDGAIVYPATLKERPMWRVLDSSGHRLAAFGRQGDGPGEFRRPLYLQVRGDSLRIFDSQRMVQLQYDWNGKALKDAPALLFDILLGWVGDSLDHWGAPGMGSSGPPVLLRSALGSREGREVISPTDSGFQAILASRPGGRISLLPYVVAPNRIYLADAWHYRIYSYDASGHPITSFGRELPPHHRGPREFSEDSASIAQLPKFTRGPKGDAVPFPDGRGRLDTLARELTPFFNRAPLHVDQFDRLWVVGVTNDSTTVDVFADTTFLGRVVLPCYLGRRGSPVALTWPWLLLECELPDSAEQNSELQLYRIVETGAVAHKP